MTTLGLSSNLTVMDQEIATQNIKETTDLVDLHGTHIAPAEPGDDNPLVGLTDFERRYVEAYAALAGSHGAMTRAAEYAGYSPKTCAVKGSTLLKKPKILKALRFLTEHKAHAAGIMAMSTLEELARTGTDAIRLKAAERLLGYSGIIIKTISKVEHDINDNRTPEQIRAAIGEKAAKLGIDFEGMKIVSPPKRAVTEAEMQGAPRYKKSLIPNRPLTDEEVDEIDWLNAKVDIK